MHRGNTEPVIKRMIELPSPRGVRVASGIVILDSLKVARCRPREGCGLHHKRNLLEDQIEAHLVAVPVRGAGCIPHGKQELQGQELHHFSVPVRGAGCIGVVRKKNNFITLLPSPRGVRVASCNLNFDDGAKAPLPSPRGARAVSTAPLCTAPQAARCCPREGCGLYRRCP